MEVQKYLTVVKKWWWLVLVSLPVFALSSYLIVSQLPPIYASTTTLRVGQTLESPNPSYQDFYVSQELAHTYMNMATRLIVLSGAADALGLPSVPRARDVSARIVPNTQFLEVTVRDRNPDRARALADAVAQQLILQAPEGVAEDQAQRAFVQAQLQDLQEDIQAARKQITAEQRRLDAGDSAGAAQQGEDSVTALQQKLASYRSTYAALLQTVSNRTNDIAIFEPATTPSRPVSPRIPHIIAIVTVIGLGLVLGGAYLIESVNDTVKTTGELAQVTQLPVLGTISRMKGEEPGETPLAMSQPRSRLGEDCRTLRTNLQFSSVGKSMQTVVVTSPGQFEGKTTIATNLGVVLAQSGKSVALVDSDLRRPRLHQIFGLRNSHGLTDSLTQDERVLDGWLQPTGIENLRVLTSGPLPPNPSELLGSQEMDRIIEQLKVQADVVIFDTPPTLSVTDAAVLASQADGVLLVAEAGRTRRGAVVRAMENLQQVGGNVLGGVLNKFSSGRSDAYYYGEPSDSRR